MIILNPAAVGDPNSVPVVAVPPEHVPLLATVDDVFGADTGCPAPRWLYRLPGGGGRLEPEEGW